MFGQAAKNLLQFATTYYYYKARFFLLPFLLPAICLLPLQFLSIPLYSFLSLPFPFSLFFSFHDGTISHETFSSRRKKNPLQMKIVPDICLVFFQAF